MKKLSVVMAVYNEEENIGRCLESIKDIADEIVVVDGNSTDKTVAIAKKYKAKVMFTKNSETHFHVQKNMAIDAAIGEWILQLDADEIVPPELAQEILLTINHERSTIDGYWMNRKNWFLSRFLTKGGQYPDPTLRLYRNGKGRLPARDVHEQAVVEGKTGKLKHDLLHYRDRDFKNYLLRNNRYTSLLAEQFAEQHLSINPISCIQYLVLKPVREFLWIYIRHRGYIDGFPGFVFALFSSLRFAIAYIKYWQITKFPSYD